ncbi:MAG: hypothetical protein A2X86_03580 [Bdellovibrionales bacterium GWA2_49_15]|nr:MAG: hypothetical protein A2X86_03580 [Bdellovibrionales bacterium GWA2_49_15]HAZ12297.1 hypothetical protein [Bdellovibrionales bacterium]
MKYLLLALLVVSFVHCASNPNQLTEAGKKVQIMSGKKPMEGCEVVDKVIAENEIGSIQVSTNKVRNIAAQKGANYVLIEDEILNGSKAKVIATAYTCTE